MDNFDVVYSDILRDVLANGELQSNRTGIDTLFKIGKYFELEVASQFPLLTTKKIYWKSAFAEMIGFILGYSNASDFRRIGCNVWNQNANENQQWLNNPARLGPDDLGAIYGVQWRSWATLGQSKCIDQLELVVNDLKNGIDNRREIVTAWNPGELDIMALPPCHMTMIFSLVKESTTVDLFVLVRSNDVFLGMPFNVAQYAFLLHLIAQITNKTPGTLRYYANNVHIYQTHLDVARAQSLRMPMQQKPRIEINSDIRSLVDLDIDVQNKLITDVVTVHDYVCHPPLLASMAV